MMTAKTQASVLAGFLWLIASSIASAAPGCPFCPPTQPTFSEQLAQSDMAYLTKWVSATEKKSDDEVGEAITKFEVVEVVRPGEPKLVKGDTITVDFLRNGQPGNLFLLIGSQGEEKTAWSAPIEVSEISYGYIKQAPALEAPAEKRLKYFLKFLEFGDPLIANDAFAEFSRARYEDVAAISAALPREKLRAWLAADETTKIRLGFYGLLLGLCGNDDDAKFLEAKIFAKVAEDDVRLGIDGMMGGYLLLTGERGLERLIDGKLKTDDTQRTDLFAVLNALRFAWEYNRDRFPPDRLRAALRMYLDRDEFAEIVVADIARWKDWSVLGRLIAAYGKPPFETPSGKLKVIQFAQACIKDLSQSQADLERLEQAIAFIKRVEKESPDLVKPKRRPLPGLVPGQ